MALQILFGDDEHTATDGPYKRVLKTRKWIYLSSALAIVLAANLYDMASAADAMSGIVTLPSWLLKQAIGIGLAYLLVQYVMLLIQLLSTYDIILEERFSYRRADELAGARQRISSAVSKLQEHRSTSAQRRTIHRNELQQRLYNAEQAIKKAEELPDSAGLRLAGQEIPSMKPAAIKIAAAELQNAQKAIAEFDARGAAPTLSKTDRSLQIDIDEATAAHDRIANQDPAVRRGYRHAEVAIDLIRIVPPLVLGLTACVKLATS